MLNTRFLLQSLLLATFLFGCSNKHEKAKMQHVFEPAALDETASSAPPAIDFENGTFTSNLYDANGEGEYKQAAFDAISSSSAVENKKDTTRKFIRTADIKFRVKDIAKATYALEDIAARFDGFVTYTNLSSNITRQTVIPISADSSLETIYYVAQNTMTLRVPNIKLDSTLRALVPVIDYLDHRSIKADDVQFQLLENKFKQGRSAIYQERVSKAVDDKGKKLQETTNAEDKILSKQEQADEALISNLRLKDKIAYSTIQLFIYQREVFRRELIANDKNIEAYDSNFFAKVAEAFKFGWKILEGIFLFLAKSWGVILSIATVIALVRIVFFKRRNNAEF
ncbi:MAG: DUF4349 domain-containing protein [Chitinophagales bacterium]|nr:DUF4349 domain-containing protein [Chitinophagales bacterium]